MLQQLMKSNVTNPRPTGPYDEEDDTYLPKGLHSGQFEDADLGKEYAPHIGKAFDLYMKAHDYRKSQRGIERITTSFNQFLTAAKLHEKKTLESITKAHGRVWIEYMQTPKTFPARAVPKAVTIQSKLQIVRHFLAYCVAQDWLRYNPFEGLALPARVVSDSRTRKEMLTDVELVLIFKALKDFQVPGGKHNPHRGPYVRAPRGVLKRGQPKSELMQATPARIEFYYLCLLLAFTGARCTEILQLDTADVKQIDGIWCVDLCEASIDTPEETTKSLKNRPSARKVPIHSQLLPVFLPWFKEQRGAKLFPLLYPQGFTLPSRWFSYLLKRIKIKRRENSLHSFRHSLTVKLAQARTYPPIQNRLLGHAVGKSVEERVYMASLEFSVKELSEALEKVTFP